LDNPLHKVVKNKDGKTAREVFIEEHKPLIEEGKNWIKDRSNSCMLVATLIATITFAAAITVPGGSQDKGIPILLPDKTFIVFILSDAVAFFLSMASLVMLLPHSNGPNNEEGFAIEGFAIRLMIGLTHLVVALVATTIAFTAALSMFLGKRYKLFNIYICLFACAPILYATGPRYPNLRRIS